MKKILNLAFTVVIILTAFVLQSCTDTSGSEKKNSEEAQRVLYVETEKVKSQEFTDYISLIGIAKAYQKAELGADEGGKIKEYIKNKGEYVREGDVILVMDNDVLKANMDAAKAQYEMAEINFEKQEQIYKEKVTSELQYLNAKFERNSAKANYELIKSRYEKTFIKAPFSGIVDMKYYEEGEIVSPGVPIVSLVSIDKMKVEAGVPENYVNDVKVGNKVKVIFNDLKDAVYNETISYVGNTISPNNRTFPIEIVINNKDRRIKPELNAVVNVVKGEYDKAIVISEEVLTRTDKGYAVFVEENGVAKMRIVDIISRYNNQAAISNGLNEGDNLIVVGYQNIVDGERVKRVN
jgi:membrane fusion protein (multidrug efflux system)